MSFIYVYFISSHFVQVVISKFIYCRRKRNVYARNKKLVKVKKAIIEQSSIDQFDSVKKNILVARNRRKAI